jgi:peptidoglycan hydrolase CwlO-like protein
MTHTRIQDLEQHLTTLAKDHDQTQSDISSIMSSIGNINSQLTPLKSLPTTITQLTATCQQCQDTMNNLTALLKPTPYPFSSSTPYNHYAP